MNFSSNVKSVKISSHVIVVLNKKHDMLFLIHSIIISVQRNRRRIHIGRNVIGRLHVIYVVKKTFLENVINVDNVQILMSVQHVCRKFDFIIIIQQNNTPSFTYSIRRKFIIIDVFLLIERYKYYIIAIMQIQLFEMK